MRRNTKTEVSFEDAIKVLKLYAVFLEAGLFAPTKDDGRKLARWMAHRHKQFVEAQTKLERPIVMTPEIRFVDFVFRLHGILPLCRGPEPVLSDYVPMDEVEAYWEKTHHCCYERIKGCKAHEKANHKEELALSKHHEGDKAKELDALVEELAYGRKVTLFKKGAQAGACVLLFKSVDESSRQGLWERLKMEREEENKKENACGEALRIVVIADVWRHACDTDTHIDDDVLRQLKPTSNRKVTNAYLTRKCCVRICGNFKEWTIDPNVNTPLFCAVHKK